MAIGLRQAADQIAAADLGGELLLQGPGRAEGDLDLLAGALAEGQRVLLLHELDDRVVELVAGDTDRLAGHDATEGDDRDLGRAAADVDDHVAGGLLHGEAGTDGRGHGLLDDVGGLAGAGVLGGLLHGPLLHAGDARGDADHHAGLGEAAAVHLVDEVAEHLLAHLEVGDDAVLQRPDGLDVARRAPDHALGLEADRHGAPVADVDRDDRRLVEHDAVTAHVHEGVGSAEVDGHVAAQRQRVVRRHGAPHGRARGHDGRSLPGRSGERPAASRRAVSPARGRRCRSPGPPTRGRRCRAPGSR